MKSTIKLRERIPEMECIPGCAQCCGHVPWSPEEVDLLGDDKDKLSRLTLRCSFYDNGCTVYENRPITCRLFGVAEGMPCPRGVPVTYMPEEEVRKIMKEYSKQFGG
jgi:hypothetical protein